MKNYCKTQENSKKSQNKIFKKTYYIGKKDIRELCKIIDEIVAEENMLSKYFKKNITSDPTFFKLASEIYEP